MMTQTADRIDPLLMAAVKGPSLLHFEQITVVVQLNHSPFQRYEKYLPDRCPSRHQTTLVGTRGTTTIAKPRFLP